MATILKIIIHAIDIYIPTYISETVKDKLNILHRNSTLKDNDELFSCDDIKVGRMEKGLSSVKIASSKYQVFDFTEEIALGYEETDHLFV